MLRGSNLIIVDGFDPVPLGPKAPSCLPVSEAVRPHVSLDATYAGDLLRDGVSATLTNLPFLDEALTRTHVGLWTLIIS
jgi:hypothetical protein